MLKFTSYLSIHLIFVFVLAKFTPIPFSVRFPFFTFSVSCPFYKCIYFCHFIISPMFHCSFSPPFVFSFSLKLIFVLPFLPQQTYFFQLHCLSHFSFKTSISTNIHFPTIFTPFVNPHHEFLSHSFLPSSPIHCFSILFPPPFFPNFCLSVTIVLPFISVPILFLCRNSHKMF